MRAATKPAIAGSSALSRPVRGNPIRREMTPDTASNLRIEKQRSQAEVSLATGEIAYGHFFTSARSALHAGSERIGDLLNGDNDFIPFERQGERGRQTVIYNRAHVITVNVSPDEPRQEPGYDVATRHAVSMLLSNGRRLVGSVRVYQPDGYSRLSDWSKSRDHFQYLQTETSTLLVNREHIVEVSEIPER